MVYSSEDLDNQGCVLLRTQTSTRLQWDLGPSPYRCLYRLPLLISTSTDSLLQLGKVRLWIMLAECRPIVDVDMVMLKNRISRIEEVKDNLKLRQPNCLNSLAYTYSTMAFVHLNSV